MNTTATISHKQLVSIKKHDLIWVLFLLVIVSFLLIPRGYEIFVHLSQAHVYLMAFFKFALLATMGELLAVRILKGCWSSPMGLRWRIIIWGILGILIALVFHLYAAGVSSAISSGLLPAPGGNGWEYQLVYGASTSILMNCLFAPTFMAFHRITDTWIDMGNGTVKGMMRVKQTDVLERIDWNGFISFVVLKTIPFFWIPAHTITFMLPPEHRVLAAAFLSIALGAILATGKKISS